jgi:hypothetical protein
MHHDESQVSFSVMHALNVIEVILCLYTSFNLSLLGENDKAIDVG